MPDRADQWEIGRYVGCRRGPRRPQRAQQVTPVHPAFLTALLFPSAALASRPLAASPWVVSPGSTIAETGSVVEQP
jgi:hypothetical protein